MGLDNVEFRLILEYVQLQLIYLYYLAIGMQSINRAHMGIDTVFYRN